MSQTRLYLEAAKYHFEQMKLYPGRTSFLYYLLAFVSIGRSIWDHDFFHGEFHENKQVMDWYKRTKEERHNNAIMEFFREMRNISLHRQSPGVSGILNQPASIGLSYEIFTTSPNGTIKVIQQEKKEASKGQATLILYFDKSPEGFDEKNVLILCERYLNELEKFVAEAENIAKKGSQ